MVVVSSNIISESPDLSPVLHMTSSLYAGLFFFIKMGAYDTSRAPALMSFSITYPSSSPVESSMLEFMTIMSLLCAAPPASITSPRMTLSVLGPPISRLPTPTPISEIFISGISPYCSAKVEIIAAPVGVTSSVGISICLNLTCSLL